MQADIAQVYAGSDVSAAVTTGRAPGLALSRLAAAVFLLTFLGGCADRMVLPEPLNLPQPLRSTASEARGPGNSAMRIDQLPMPGAAAPAKGAGAQVEPRPVASPRSGEPVSLNLEQVSLATFAQLVFADVLKKNVSIDPQVVARKDLVTFRSGNPQSPAQLEAAATLLLKSFGVAALDLGGLVRVVPDNAALGTLPEIRRGAALPETPLPLRPIFHLIELQAVRHVDVMNWLRTLFGERVRAQEDASRNALLISGTPDNVQAALEAIRMLDQPVLAGGQSLALNPVNLSADEMAKRLIDVLLAQGYAVQPQALAPQPGAIRYPIVILPVASISTVYVFARGDAVIKHITELALALDKPSERGIGKTFFTYAVKHKDATSLAETLQQLLSGSSARTAASGATGGAALAAAAAAAQRTNVVIDKSTNTLIFNASQDEYPQVIALLQTLDRPAKAALIEVTVAELSVDDSNKLGVEWAFGDGNASGGTVGGLGLGTAGFNYRLLNNLGGVKAQLNALASANRATILSSPRIMARNGELATIQVGQEVPIVTSQQSTNTSAATGNTSVLQTIQYRSTGVILRVKPVIHSGDQIDLDVIQEVSSAQSTNTGVSASPTFSTRKLDTKLTLRNGSTVLLGGLISEENSRGNTGVPLLKDIPVLGHLFSNQSQGGARRELIVLITPYLINDNHDAESVTEAFRRMLGPWAAPQALPRTSVDTEPGVAPAGIPAARPGVLQRPEPLAPAAAPASAPPRTP